MLTAEIIVRSLCALIILLAFFILLGDLFFLLFRRSAFPNLFLRFYWSGLAGLVLAVSVYAIATTGFRTVLLLCPVLMVFFALALPSTKRGAESSFKKALLLFMGGALVLYFSFYLTAFISVSGEIKFPSLDNVFYARLAAYLNATGREISTPEYLFPQAYSTMPHHYGDIWLCGFISRFSGLKPPFALLLVMYPCLSLLSVLGIAGFAIQRFGFHAQWIFITFFALFFSGITLLYPVSWGDGFGTRPVANYPKVLFIAAFLSGTFSLAEKKHWNALFILAAIGSTLFINALPALMISIALLTIVHLFIFQQPLKTLVPGLLVAAVALLYFLFFYTLTATPQTASLTHTNGVAALLAVLEDPLDGLTAFTYPVLQGLMFLPFILLFFWACHLRKIPVKKIRTVLLSPECFWFVFLLLSGLAAWLITRFYTKEAPQFYYNMLLPLTSISIAVWSYWILSLKGRILLKVMVMSMLLYLLFRFPGFTYDIAYRHPSEWNALTRFLKGENNPVFINLKSNDEFQGFFQKSTRLFQPLPEINYILNRYINESLNIPYLLQDSTSNNTPADMAQYQNTSFYQYLQTKKPYTQIPAETLMLDFAKTINARYLTVSKQTLIPSIFRPFATDSLLLDNYTLYKIKLK